MNLDTLLDLENDPKAFGAHLFRIGFGILFILVAVKKFRMGIPGFAESLTSAEDLMAQEIPNLLLLGYGLAIPFIEFFLGLFLIVNLEVRKTYMGIGAVYLSFIFGQMYNGNTSKIGTEYFPSMIALVVGFYLYDLMLKETKKALAKKKK